MRSEKRTPNRPVIAFCRHTNGERVAVEFSCTPPPPTRTFMPTITACSRRYRVLFYSLEGKLVGRLEAYPHALGVKSMAWSPDGTLLSVGSYDQCVRLVSPVTWKAVAVLRHVHPKAQVIADPTAVSA